ncbi:MAG: 2-hydroxyacid dehydrogenase [Rhodospirillales bacterium]|nr:2-hydroxyacid dehydrogenase [Alphaproteobacteria bacterium]USO03866.1 MAG: 2-hydroxyacid dehydrogenase [Rhodospirillales bacterium]
MPAPVSKGVGLDFETYRPEELDLTALEGTLERWDIHYHTKPDEIAQRIEGAHVVISNKVVLTREIIENAPDLKLIAVAATGVNNVDLEAAKEAGVTVCNVTNYATEAVTQHVFALILALATGLTQYNDIVRQGRWQASRTFSILDFPITELAGKTLGIVGHGTLGRGVEAIARAFGMEVLIAERPGAGDIREGRRPFEDVLKQSDILTLHCPLTPETENLITAKELAMMKDSAFLINTARGGVVNEQDLADALRAGTIAGAGVDVLSREPPREGNPLLEPDVPNIIVTPHTAWASREARQRLMDQLAENIAAFKSGTPRNVVV